MQHRLKLRAWAEKAGIAISEPEVAAMDALDAMDRSPRYQNR